MNRLPGTAVLFLTAILVSPVSPASAVELEVGVAVSDITPPVPYRMSGYFQERLSSGSHDPLQAKAMVLRQGETQAALVFCDLIGIPLELSGRARREAGRRTGIPASNILIAATHSHTGPLYFGALREHFHARALVTTGKDPHERFDYPKSLVSRLVETIARAHHSLAPAELRAGTSRQEGLSFNRRFHMKNGAVRFNPGKQNPDIVRVAGPIDPELGLLLVRDPESGKALAGLTVFALHLDTVGGALYSADFPLYLERRLRRSLGPEFVSMFGAGTCGDINHIDVSHTQQQKGQEEARRIGETLGRTVSEALEGLAAVKEPSLAVRSATVAVPLQEFSEAEQAAARRDIEKVGSSELPFLEQVRAYKVLAVGMRRRQGETIPLEAQVFRLSGDVAIVGLPGEVFVELGLAIKEASPFRTTIVVELANDAPGYIPTEKAFREGSYETVNSRVKPGGGERLVETAVGLLKELAPQGRARRAPVFDRRSDASGKPIYRIYPLRNGVCSVKGPHAFQDNDDDSRSYPYALYVWLVLGGEKPILVDAGLEDVEHMNRGAAKVFDTPISQDKNETTAAQLRKFGLTHEDIGHVFVTHLHFDHVDEIFKYRNATFHIGKKEWEGVTANGTRGSWCDGRVLFKLMRPEWREKMRLIEDEEVLPGFESFWVGGHTKGSMAYRINTEHGKAVVTGDTISLLSNLERPVGVFWNADEVEAAMKRIRESADVVLPSHDPGTLDRWPPLAAGTPKYTIRAVRVGECRVTDEITFQDAWGENRATRPYNLYVWVIEGGERPIVVDTGPNPLYVEEFNRSTAKYIIGGLKQTPEEDTRVALKRAGIDPEDVSHVIVTHCHADHYDYISAFPGARFVINETELENSREKFPPDVVRALDARPDVILPVGDREIVPGIRTVPLGCHTEGSQGVLVQTHVGPVMLTGDVVYMYQNIEEDRPGRSPSPEACKEAMAKIRRLADLVLPSHDPLTLERWPGGVIGGKPEHR